MMTKIVLVLVSLLMVVGCYGYLAHKQLQDVKDEYLECTDHYYKLQSTLDMERQLNDLTPDAVDQWLREHDLLTE